MPLNFELGHITCFSQWDVGANNTVPVSSLALMRPLGFHLPFALLSSPREDHGPNSLLIKEAERHLEVSWI